MVMDLQAKRPDLAIMMYRDKMQWDDALRVAEYSLPSKVPDIHSDLAEYMQRYDTNSSFNSCMCFVQEVGCN
jgi:hypothetical protein